MPWRRACVAVAIVLGCCGLEAAAPKKPQKTDQKTDPGRLAVEKVLRSELVGTVDRRDQLAEVLKTRPDSPAAHWHAGYVKEGAAWRSFDEPLRDEAAVKFLDEYRRRRNESPQDFRNQLKLANWCRKEGARDREQAHLLEALRLGTPEEQPALLERLGYVQVGTQWLSSEQVRDCQHAIRQAQASLKKWSPKLERIAQRLDENKLRREGALAELRSLAEPSAVPAIELILAGRSAESAHLVVELFKQIKGPAASLGLAKQAVFSRWPEVRRSASSALKERTFEDFVPALISLLATPAVGQQSLFYDPSRGGLVYSYLVGCEMENQFQVAALTVTSPLVVRIDPTRIGVGRTDDLTANQAALRLRLQGSATDTERLAADAINVREHQREATNERIEELNARVIDVLKDITGSEATGDARRWWQWWYDFTDAPPAGEKAVVLVDETEITPPPIVFIFSHSCFAAGTTVWTESGAMPIEKIRIGDRVLAQDIESGELSLKPVLLTTVNPPKELMTLRLADESIVCTKGHRFWSSGSGWTKARDLEPETFLHTATATTPVRSVKAASAEKTYNLIVDGFHTYFVGKAAVLCEDLHRTNPTDRAVPGLSSR